MAKRRYRVRLGPALVLGVLLVSASAAMVALILLTTTDVPGLLRATGAR
jgi:hypothetical protein